MRKLFSIGAALIFATAIASASVTFDPNTGGFVGKGDVQLAFGWNNAQLQKNASLVTFSYDSVDTYSATCTWVTGEGTKGEKIHNVEHNRRASVASTVAFSARTHSQIDGFILTALGDTVTEGTAPVVGGTCVGGETGNGQDGTWSAVTLVSSTGGLYVNYGGIAVLLKEF